MNVPRRRFTHPRRRKVVTKPRRVLRKRGGKFGNPKSMKPQNNNYAKVVETIEWQDLSSNTMYGFEVSLQDTTRALALAPQFQWYRITAVNWKYETVYDTYQAPSGLALGAGTVTPTIPQLYRLMNRAGTYQATTLQELAEQGAKPFKFTKNVNMKYKPNTLVTTSYAGVNNEGGDTLAQSYASKFNQWLPTATATGGAAPLNAWQQIPYYGHQCYFDQDITEGQDSQKVAKVTVSLVVEFKNPSVNTVKGLDNVTKAMSKAKI